MIEEKENLSGAETRSHLPGSLWRGVWAAGRRGSRNGGAGGYGGCRDEAMSNVLLSKEDKSAVSVITEHH